MVSGLVVLSEMLAIIATHPIQYHVPLWQLLAADGRVPFEVWYLSEHATRRSRDREFQQDFAWDLDMLKGYPHQILKGPEGVTPNTPLRMRLGSNFAELLKNKKVETVWVQGWQVAAYWQAAATAHKLALQVWLRGESNAMAPARVWRKMVKRPLLGALFKRVDHFLCIGSANRELYRTYGVAEPKLHMTPYAVDNDRFRLQAEAIRSQTSEIRRQWRIPDEAFVILFCGKFIPKKRPMDLIRAAEVLQKSKPESKVHLLFVGSGELGAEMRAACNVVYDAEADQGSEVSGHRSDGPSASFTGFLNQTEISKAYVAADVLVLASDYGETWGLVVNEAMASGLRCVISDHCGCAPDLGVIGENQVFRCGDVAALAERLGNFSAAPSGRTMPAELPSLRQTADVVSWLHQHGHALKKNG